MAAAAVGDLDDDGTSEIAVGAPYATPPSGSVGEGVVWVYSGATLEPFCTLAPTDGDAGDRFGESVAAGGDATGDGVPDIFVGAPGYDEGSERDVGSVVLFSGADCSEVRRAVVTRVDRDDKLGSAIAVGDITGDGLADVAAVGGGRIYVYDVQMPHPWRDFFDPLAYIESVAVIGDVNADGIPDVLGGAPRDDRWGTDAGSVTVFSGLDGEIVRTLVDPEVDSSRTRVGTSVAGVDDITGDGVPDILAGAFADSMADRGILVFSGADGTFVRKLEYFGIGSSVVGLRDLTGDGVPDIAAAAVPAGGSAPVALFSGADGQVFRLYSDPDVTDWRAVTVVDLGDLTGDGAPEIAAAAPWNESERGRLSLFAFEDDCDGDTFTPFQGDCDDQDAAVRPDAEDLCGDGLDLDCIPGDGTTEPWYGTACDGADLDLCEEGILVCAGGAQACDDVTAHSAEVCSGLDDDCNGQVDDVACSDHDLDGDGRVGGVELSWIGRAFSQCSANPDQEWWGRADLDRDGCIDGDDLAILANLWARTCSGPLVSCE
jgi:hypothetical protein